MALPKRDGGAIWWVVLFYWAFCEMAAKNHRAYTNEIYGWSLWITSVRRTTVHHCCAFTFALFAVDYLNSVYSSSVVAKREVAIFRHEFQSCLQIPTIEEFQPQILYLWNNVVWLATNLRKSHAPSLLRGNWSRTNRSKWNLSLDAVVIIASDFTTSIINIISGSIVAVHNDQHLSTVISATAAVPTSANCLL